MVEEALLHCSVVRRLGRAGQVEPGRGEVGVDGARIRRAGPAGNELAALEDATAWGVFRRITLPLMAPILLLLLARDTIYSLQWTFVPALVVTEGGPPEFSTTYVPLFVYRNAFEFLRYGYAAAATLLMFALTALIVWLQWRIVRHWRKGFAI